MLRVSSVAALRLFSHSFIPAVNHHHLIFTSACVLAPRPHASHLQSSRRSAKLSEMFGNEEERMRLEEEAELVEDWVESEIEVGGAERNQAREAEFKHRQMVKRKIIEHKYFRPPQETNLLTWAAKEQIRFLHGENPEEWTPQRLSESFPASIEGILKILRSSFCPSSQKEIEKHDARVRQHWLALSGGKMKTSTKKLGEVKSAQKSLTGGGSEPPVWLPNAAGNSALPTPEHGRFSDERKYKAPGKFESIVKDYCEKKAVESNMKESRNNLNSKQILEIADSEKNDKQFLSSTERQQGKNSKAEVKYQNENSALSSFLTNETDSSRSNRVSFNTSVQKQSREVANYSQQKVSKKFNSASRKSVDKSTIISDLEDTGNPQKNASGRDDHFSGGHSFSSMIDVQFDTKDSVRRISDGMNGNSIDNSRTRFSSHERDNSQGLRHSESRSLKDRKYSRNSHSVSDRTKEWDYPQGARHNESGLRARPLGDQKSKHSSNTCSVSDKTNDPREFRNKLNDFQTSLSMASTNGKVTKNNGLPVRRSETDEFGDIKYKSESSRQLKSMHERRRDATGPNSRSDPGRNNPARRNDIDENSSSDLGRHDRKYRSDQLRHDPDRREVYMYDEEKGYQYPLGRRSDVPSDRIRRGARGRGWFSEGGGEVRQRGNEVYDDDGEFLYKTP